MFNKRLTPIILLSLVLLLLLSLVGCGKNNVSKHVLKSNLAQAHPEQTTTVTMKKPTIDEDKIIETPAEENAVEEENKGSKETNDESSNIDDVEDSRKTLCPDAPEVPTEENYKKYEDTDYYYVGCLCDFNYDYCQSYLSDQAYMVYNETFKDRYGFEPYSFSYSESRMSFLVKQEDIANAQIILMRYTRMMSGNITEWTFE